MHFHGEVFAQYLSVNMCHALELVASKYFLFYILAYQFNHSWFCILNSWYIQSCCIFCIHKITLKNLKPECFLIMINTTGDTRETTYPSRSSDFIFFPFILFFCNICLLSNYFYCYGICYLNVLLMSSGIIVGYRQILNVE